MRDEDDDLLRMAEELGIDLSGVRATDGDAADESEEIASRDRRRRRPDGRNQGRAGRGVHRGVRREPYD